MKRKYPGLTVFLKVSAVLLVLTAALLVYSSFDPQHSEWFPKCPFRAFTGLDCPGCGSQRAVYQLLHGNLAKAFHYNALMVLFIPYIIIGVFLDFCPKLLSDGRTKDMLARIRLTLYNGKAVWVVLFIILAFWITRNLVEWL